MLKKIFIFLLFLFFNKLYPQSFSTYFSSHSMCTIDENNNPVNCKNGDGGVVYQGVTINVFNEIKLITKTYEVITNKWDSNKLVYDRDSDMYLYDLLNAYADVRGKDGSVGIAIILSNNYIPLALVQNTNVNGQVIQLINKK